jgi:hypothetical protein
MSEFGSSESGCAALGCGRQKVMATIDIIVLGFGNESNKNIRIPFQNQYLGASPSHRTMLFYGVFGYFYKLKIP